MLQKNVPCLDENINLLTKKGLLMNNYKLQFSLTSKDIRNKLSEDDKKKFDNIKITNAYLADDETVIVECIISSDPIKSSECVYKLIGDGCVRLD